jgi:hypothetical protein
VDPPAPGTTTLFAALNVLEGTVTSRNMQQHRHPEFIRFLNALDRDIPAGKLVHAIMDNYAKLTRRRLKHGVFHSVVDLQAAINRFVDEHNQNPKLFVWRADPNHIIAARSRGFQALESVH